MVLLKNPRRVAALLLRLPVRALTDATEWVEYNHVDTQPSLQVEHLPEYDDPFLRADHPFWQGNPPESVVAGQHTWTPPQRQQGPAASSHRGKPVVRRDKANGTKANGETTKGA